MGLHEKKQFYNLFYNKEMTKQELYNQFRDNHLELADFITALSEYDFGKSYNDKWTPGQQLSHVYLCLQPIARAMENKDFIIQKFGYIDREVQDYDTIISHYTTTLLQGGKAPDKFVPKGVTWVEKNALIKNFQELIAHFAFLFDNYSEKELHSLILPHPLLGNLTLTEMFYLMTHHATHHLRQTQNNLNKG